MVEHYRRMNIHIYYLISIWPYGKVHHLKNLFIRNVSVVAELFTIKYTHEVDLSSSPHLYNVAGTVVFIPFHITTDLVSLQFGPLISVLYVNKAMVITDEYLCVQLSFLFYYLLYPYMQENHGHSPLAATNHLLNWICFEDRFCTLVQTYLHKPQ